MTRETYLREKILEHGTVKEFAEKIDMPYTTLLSILKNVGGASINNVIKICAGLGITADMLAEVGDPITIPGQKDEYYKDPEATEFAEYLQTRPSARMLFSAAKDISKEEIEEAVKYIEFLKSKHK
ncbi:helix-turn-helix transcriptional regulator [Veillonella sp. AS16]|uniref:helix-turn-helix domain-containing protein n=1 Tax=Veillonella sp. AS16 TaxID=936589 RepID=UPI0003E1BE4E|nr:helix-turn-helix transcriptional regulator [Veillonella sp. AS16]ETS91607.1 DNA-binding helix-turn-helix protein [Veillonella sp. AS16]